MRWILSKYLRARLKITISADIDSYQGVLEHALSKVDTDFYMLPNNLNVNIEKTAR